MLFLSAKTVLQHCSCITCLSDAYALTCELISTSTYRSVLVEIALSTAAAILSCGPAKLLEACPCHQSKAPIVVCITAACLASGRMKVVSTCACKGCNWFVWLFCCCSGSWRSEEFKPFNFNSLGLPPTGGHLHPLMKVGSSSSSAEPSLPKASCYPCVHAYVQLHSQYRKIFEQERCACATHPLCLLMPAYILPCPGPV
jgi:hypothetical protein